MKFLLSQFLSGVASWAQYKEDFVVPHILPEGQTGSLENQPSYRLPQAFKATVELFCSCDFIVHCTVHAQDSLGAMSA